VRSSGARRGVVIGLCALVLVGVMAKEALAKPVIVGKEGIGAGEYRQPKGVGVDRSSGDVSVLDQGNHRINVFGATNEFVLAWGLGVLSGAQELQACTSETGCEPAAEHARGVSTLGAFSPEVGGLAIDQTSGDVWVSDEERIQKFSPTGEGLLQIGGSQINEAKSPLAVDRVGDLWVGENERVQEFDSSGTLSASVALVGVGEISALAVTGAGADVYVIGSAAPGVREFETATGSQVGGVIEEAGGPQALALDASGNLFVGGGEPYSFNEYSPTGVQLEQFGAGQVIGHPGPCCGLSDGGSDAIAVESEGHSPSLYSASGAKQGEASAVQRFPLPEVGKPLPEGEHANSVEPTSATLEATLDPENHPTTYHFEYGTEPGVYTHSTPTETLPGSEFTAETVKAAVAGLLPETAYYFRLSVRSAEGAVYGEGASFTTPSAVLVESESALDISSGSAGFEGVLNPQGVGAEWWVEYGIEEGVFDHSTGKQPLPASAKGVSVDLHEQSLEASTVYHYRFVATDEREGHGYTSYGQTQSFTTQSAAPAFSLLDGRAWEMVSPLNKQGASFVGNSKEGAINQAAASGAGVTYAATASIEVSPAGEPALEDVQILSEHGAAGWSSHDIASPHEQGWLPPVGRFTEFFAFAPDLSVGLVEPKGTTLLGGASERTPYLRLQSACEAPTRAGECYLPLVTAEDVTSDERWGGKPDEPRGDVFYAASTPDLSHVVLSSRVPLTTEAEGSTEGLYEWSAGRLELVSMLPGNPRIPVCGRMNESVGRHVISVSGDRVVWNDCKEQHLYMSEAGEHRTVQLDEVQNGVSGRGESKATFQDASTDGSRVFFTDQQQLTPDSHAITGAPDLYVYEANPDGDSEAGAVRDLTVTARSGETADVLGVIPGVSADGSVAYVVATGVLSEAANGRGETPQSGQPNLYRIERGEVSGKASWTTMFVATLSSEDNNDWGGLNTRLSDLTASVSEDGRWLAFMSSRSLTGYDSRDAVSGRRDQEVFLYDAATQGLTCASCNPTHARPHGSSAIPTWESTSDGIGGYQSRYLSDGGQLFFSSEDALVPQDVNGTTDVYEYEPVGVGSCVTMSAAYSAWQGGCVALISSGISSEESEFLDASENGNDVFFLTSGKLVADDTDNAYDVYDAHVCGSGWECPPPVAVEPPCTSTASCRAAPMPQPSVFGASGSATFSGAGNQPSVVKHRMVVRCGKGRLRRRGRCVKRRKSAHGSKAGKRDQRARKSGRDRRAR
jgi:hypothetical protein